MESCQMIFLCILITLISESAAVLPPPDVSNISFTTYSDVCEDNETFLALFIVLSHPLNIQRRHVIRETYPAKEIDALGLRRIFVLGDLGVNHEEDPYREYLIGDASETMLEDESEWYEDIIQMNATDDYRKLTYKSLAAMTWAVNNCPKAKFIVKTDDDMTMDYYGAAAFLESIPEEDVDSLNGPVFPNEQPNHDLHNWKHYTSPREYPYRYYPDFIGGSFYATSPKTMKILLETAKTVNFLNSEDVFFTGLVARKAKVRLIDSFNVTGSVDYTLNCCTGPEGEIYQCQYFLSLQDVAYNPLTRKDAERYKSRWQYCLTHECETYTPEIAAAKNLTCF